MERGHLLRAGTREQRRARWIPFEPIDFSLIASADDEGTGLIECQVVRRIVARFPELVPDAVGRNAIDRAFRCATVFAWLATRAPAHVDDRHRCDLDGDRRNR